VHSKKKSVRRGMGYARIASKFREIEQLACSTCAEGQKLFKLAHIFDIDELGEVSLEVEGHVLRIPIGRNKRAIEKRRIPSSIEAFIGACIRKKRISGKLVSKEGQELRIGCSSYKRLRDRLAQKSLVASRKNP
jgi:hypothetical protein